MHRTNLFDGDSLFAIFVRITYERLMSRNWVTYADIITHAKKKQSVNDLENCVSNYDEYVEIPVDYEDGDAPLGVSRLGDNHETE